MSDLLGTDVLLELTRRRPDARVAQWLGAAAEESLYLSVLSLGELRHGVERVRDGRRREKARAFVERDLVTRFEDRLLPVSAAVAARWGRLAADIDGPVPSVESLLAATALAHGLRMVTRNVRGFRFPGLEVFNPWEAGG